MKLDSKQYFIYQTTNMITGKIYVGRHIGKIGDGYLGSGTRLLRAIKKYGEKSFRIDIICEVLNAKDLRELEAFIVDEKFLNRKDVYNIAKGGHGSWEHVNPLTGDVENIQKYMIHTIDKFGKYHYVYKTDERYLSGELKSAKKDVTMYKDSTGKNFALKKNDPRIKELKLISMNTGTVLVRFKDGSTGRIKLDDQRYINKEVNHINKDMVTVEDKEGRTSIVSKKDPRYISGELKSTLAADRIMKDATGKISRLKRTDPRIKNEALVGLSKDYKRINNGVINKFVHKDKVNEYLEKGFRLGMLKETKPRKKEIVPRKMKTLTCPHCYLSSKSTNMKRYHFNNCKKAKSND